mmetsp:Transcript_796/g.596  ORF Transcript_796/g.596 Transcript_796/m.596 type:complete len:131 (-) Transcript_796:993-1385(-)
MQYDISLSKIFTCKRCGNCCKGYGGTYVTDNDIAAIANFIQTDIKKFIKKFCQISGKRHILGQKKGGFCIFWNNLCTIHPVKPKMCRDWPFIESVVNFPENWHIIADSCPEINNEIPIEKVIECLLRSKF